MAALVTLGCASGADVVGGGPDRSCSISRVRSKSSNGPSLAGDTRNRQRLPVFETLHWRQHYAGSNIEAKDKPGLALPHSQKYTIACFGLL
jgi:hypothetical protein